MIDLSPEICLKIKEARRAAKLSQQVVATEVGCKQSALSMFEQGDGTKLNEAVIRRLAERFGISLETSAVAEEKPVLVAFPPVEDIRARGFCPNPSCPTNTAYSVDGRTYLRPDRSAADPVGGRYCAFCGEVLAKRCPNCGAPVHDGAICSICGDPYLILA